MRSYTNLGAVVALLLMAAFASLPVHAGNYGSVLGPDLSETGLLPEVPEVQQTPVFEKIEIPRLTLELKEDEEFTDGLLGVFMPRIGLDYVDPKTEFELFQWEGGSFFAQDLGWGPTRQVRTTLAYSRRVGERSLVQLPMLIQTGPRASGFDCIFAVGLVWTPRKW